MTSERAIWRNPWLRLSLVVAAGVCASGCADVGKVNPLTYGGIDPNSPVAADIATAERTPGPMPRFAQAPPAPKDVRPATAWRDSVAETWSLKRRTEAEAAAIPFALAVGDTEAWAAAERAKIPAAEMNGPSADVSAETEAFAATERARATPPPPPK